MKDVIDGDIEESRRQRTVSSKPKPQPTPEGHRSRASTSSTSCPHHKVTIRVQSLDMSQTGPSFCVKWSNLAKTPSCRTVSYTFFKSARNAKELNLASFCDLKKACKLGHALLLASNAGQSVTEHVTAFQCPIKPESSDQRKRFEHRAHLRNPSTVPYYLCPSWDRHQSTQMHEPVPPAATNERTDNSLLTPEPRAGQSSGYLG